MNDNYEKYNGWTNYATWRVNLEFFDGDDVSYTPVNWDEIAEQPTAPLLSTYP